MNRNIHNFFKAITLIFSFLFTSAFANGLAPDSIDGSVITYTEPGSTDVSSVNFSSDGKAYDDNSGEWKTYFIYEKISENVARLTYTYSNEQPPQPEVETLTFTSANGGTYDGVEYAGTTMTNPIDQHSGQFSITLSSGIDHSIAGQTGSAPDSIAGVSISYAEIGSLETTSFSNDGKVYGDKDGEWTYYEYLKLSQNVGQVTYTFSNESNPQPEVETLNFTYPNGGNYSWTEYTDSTQSTPQDQSIGLFSLNSSSVIAPDSLVGFTIRAELTANDGYESVFKLTFEDSQVIQSSEDGTSTNSMTYTMLKPSPTKLAITLVDTDSADNVLTLNFADSMSGIGIFDDYANFTSSPDSSFAATSTPGKYLDLQGSGVVTFSVISQSDSDQTSNIDGIGSGGETPGGIDGQPMEPGTGGEGGENPANADEALADFDAQTYLDMNPDLKDVFGDNFDAAKDHFLTNGFTEGRPYMDTAEAGGSDGQPMEPGTGGEGGENPANADEALADFDAQTYLDMNPDLKDVFGDNLDAAKDHFITNGFTEGRPYMDTAEAGGSDGQPMEPGTGGEGGENPANADEALADFDAQTYLDMNPDLKDVFGDNLDAAKDHFLNNGFTEGRPYMDTAEAGGSDGLPMEPGIGDEGGENPANADEALADFDAQTYLDMNPDLKDVFGDDLEAAKNHFTEAGFTEGRPYKDTGDGAQVDNTHDGMGMMGPRIEWLPPEEVDSFVYAWIGDQAKFQNARIMMAEKLFDTKDQNRFIYHVDLDNGFRLIFDSNQDFVHAESSDEFAYVEEESLALDALPTSVSDALQNSNPDYTITEVVKEFAFDSEPDVSGERKFIYIAVIEKDGEKLEVGLDQNGSILLTTDFVESEFEQNEWKPVELPQTAKDYLATNYKDGDFPIGYFVEERPTGQGKELVAILDNGVEVIFDDLGGSPREMDPWKMLEENLDAGLKFDSSRSSWGDARADFASAGSYVHIQKVEDGDSDSADSTEYAPMQQGMCYRISLVSQEVDSNATPELGQLDLSGGNLAAGTKLSLTFTYEMSPPRYLIVSGANVTGFKHRLSDFDQPGSFTIQAETVSPLASASNPSGLVSSTFGITVEMGGERFYEGSIFVTNVVGLDVGAAENSLPWDPVASFNLNGLSGTETAVSAFLPRRMLMDQFQIFDPNEVKAAIVDNNGTLAYIAGSIDPSEEDGSEVGYNFSRTPYKGHEPRMEDPAMYLDPSNMEGSEYLLDDSEFGISDATTNATETNQGNDAQSDQTEGGIAASKFDFDGDQFANSLLKISFTASNFPGDVQIGDPFVDPYAALNESDFGTVSGTVLTDTDGTIAEYDVWFIKVPEAGQDRYSGEPVFFNFERGENGAYTAKLPAGSYYAEAFGFDPETGTPYKPEFALENGSERVFEITSSDDSLTHNFTLEAEYRMSFEFIPLTGSVSKDSTGPIQDVFFDLFPVENGARVTDYPVASFGVDREGNVRGEAPAGTFEVEVFSPDNSLRLDSALTLMIPSDVPSHDLGSIELSERSMVSVGGSFADSSNNPIWADVIFVNPNDLEEQFWPVWDDSVQNLQDGEFAVKIPEGDYLVLAERFDGMFVSKFYDGDSNGLADVLTINANFNQSIDFVLESRPSATINIKLIDSNTSLPVKYAWFDFFDAEDEFGPIIFPEVNVDFEDPSFDGSYTLKVPGGTYKFSVGADRYENMFRILDESGSETWSKNTTWEDGSKIILTDGNVTDLGSVSMSAFEKSDADLYGFNWMDEGTQISGSTIKGSVKTASGSKGSVVPKARIIAHTDDYLFWFDHTISRSDGSFEISNLPEGNWMVFAEPPYDSESFRGFRESSPIQVPLPEDNGSSYDLILQGSNVSGRILFPKREVKTGENQNNALAHAFVWAFRDEDKDGEPDYDAAILNGEDQLSEAFGETDEDGFFSFYLEDAGSYSLRIEMPGELSALAPAPIQFSLKNPADSLKLGNAIKIDWESKVNATSFDIERKSSTESSYQSLFSSDVNSTGPDKPTAGSKTFVDATLVTGETYSYRVVAETSSGKVTLDSTTVRVSKPMIFLAPPSKTISGRVADANNTLISGAEVVAWREEGEGWSSTFTGDDGTYELTGGPGKWEITVYRPHDTKVDWDYDNAPERFFFKQDASKESKTINFTVSRLGLAGGKVKGSIAIPTGKTGADLAQYVFVDVFDPEGRGNWSNPDSSGNFEIPVEPGAYELSIWVAPELTGFGSPEFQIVRVGSSTVDIGELQLTSRNQSLTGTVTTNTGKALPNVEVWAWSNQGGWVSDFTNVSGEYTLAVSPGKWEIGYDLPMPADGSEPPYLPEPPKRVQLKQNDSSKSINFTAKEAGAQVSGTVYGPNGGPVSDLNGWVYAREYSPNAAEDEFYDIVAEVPLSSRGTFSFPGVAGEYIVGLWLPPGSGYVNPEEKYYNVSDTNGVTTLTDYNQTVQNEVSFSLTANDATVSGAFTLNANAATGLTGEVYAISTDGEGWQSAPIEDNGTYSMLLSPGSWTLDYYIDSDSQSRNIPKYPAETYIVTALKSSTVTQNFVLATATASISGSVKYDADGTSVTDSTLYVWASREGTESIDEHWNEVETDANGSFVIPVLPGGTYEVGAILSKDLRDRGYLDSTIVEVDLSSSNVTDLNLTILIPSNSNFISGAVKDATGNAVEGADVYAWADDGREVSGTSLSDGTFSLPVSPGTVWHVGAEFSIFDDNGTESFFFTKVEADADLNSAASQSDLSLMVEAPDFELPEGSSITFDPTVDFVTKLPDGTELTIPGGAANVASDVTSVRLVVTPTAKGLSKSSTEKPADYGYSVDLFDSSGKTVEGNFKKDVILSVKVDVNASRANGMDVENIEGMYYSTTKDAWDKAKTSTWDLNSSTLTMTTDHFTTFAPVSSPDVSDLAEGLAKVDASASGDWYSSTWFGYFYDASSDWIYHSDLGWLYVKKDSNSNFWFFDSKIGWFWTGSTYYDVSQSKYFVYSSTESSWLYFKVVDGVRKFYDYSDQTWLTPDSN